jgi:hypothetical protein
VDLADPVGLAVPVAPVGLGGGTAELITAETACPRKAPRRPVGGLPYSGSAPNAAYTSLLRTTLRGSALAFVASNRFGTYA